MARGINKVILVGNLGADPEVRHTPNNTVITTVNLATSSSWRDKNTGESQEKTEWHRVVFFNKLAEIARDYLKKGAQVYVEGSLRTNKWTDKNGAERYTTEIIANEMQMLGSRNGGGQGGNAQPYYQDQQEQQPTTAARQPSAANPTHSPADFDDDIPF